MNSKFVAILFCIILVCFVLYKLYINENTIEHFGILEKMKNNSKQKKEKQKKEKFSNTKSSKSTFDDLFKATEHMKPDNYTIDNMYKKIYEYKDSFNKEKFKNNSKTTAESFEKFAFYKDQFFNIFK
jgi:hypothetical protein